MLDYVEILGVKINKVDMEQAVEHIARLIQAKGNSMVVTPNSEMIVLAQDDKEFADILNKADLSVPDGAGVVLASRLLQNPVPERVAGFDLMQETLKLANEMDCSIYLLGGEPGIVDVAAEKIKQQNPDIKISGMHHGFLDEKLKEQILTEINKLKPDILFLGMGVPLQEKFLNKHLSQLNVSLAMAIGGSFDVLAERVKRAPIWLQRLNLEWLYRLIQEPSRFGRMMALPKFVYMVISAYIKRN